MAPSSRPRPSFVTRLEPTFTTMRRAPRSRCRCSGPRPAPWESAMSALPWRGCVSEPRIDLLRLLLRMARVHVLEHGLDQLLATFAGQRRDLEHRALVAHALDEILDARLALFDRHHVQLVEHQPARLVKQRLVVLLQLGH